MRKMTVPAYWTAHEARAVIEFLDELKAHIDAVYGQQIVELCRDEHEQGLYQVTATGDEKRNDDGEPF